MQINTLTGFQIHASHGLQSRAGRRTTNPALHYNQGMTHTDGGKLEEALTVFSVTCVSLIACYCRTCTRTDNWHHFRCCACRTTQKQLKVLRPRCLVHRLHLPVSCFRDAKRETFVLDSPGPTAQSRESTFISFQSQRPQTTRNAAIDIEPSAAKGWILIKDNYS